MMNNILVLMLSAAALQAADNLTPGAFYIDPPTRHCLAFRWEVAGDDNLNAAARVRYCEGDTLQFKSGLPLLRNKGDVVNRDYEAFTTGNLFAGSLVNLKPGTEYTVSIILNDPDGGQADTLFSAGTKPYPPVFLGSDTLHVYPPTYSGARIAPFSMDLSDAIANAGAGAILLVHPGIHIGTYSVRKTGLPDAPIVLRGTPEGEAILDGNNTTGRIFDIQSSEYMCFENLTIRNGHTGIKANDTRGLVVRRCHIYNVNYGIITYTPAREWYIADNRIQGRVDAWYPRTYVETNFPDETGVMVSGLGHVVCYNTISDFWDCLTINNQGPPVDWQHPHTMAVDFYHNELYNAGDDGLEVDYGCHNIRVWNNRITNVHSGISTQPVYGGPAYLFRNFIFNALAPLKLHNWPSGLEIYHNTTVSAGAAFGSAPLWQNTILMNNLLLGSVGYSMETGSPDPATKVEYNGYYKTDDPARFIKWTPDAGTTWQRYATLPEFYSGDGHEEHGVMITLDDFNGLFLPGEGTTYRPDSTDCRLKAGAIPVDNAAAIPQIGETFQGTGPDMGCIEYGDPLPHYGVRDTGYSSVWHPSNQLNGTMPQVLIGCRNGIITIQYELRGTARVMISLYRPDGRDLLLLDRTCPAGQYILQYRARQLATGIYMLKVLAGHNAIYRKICLLKPAE